LTKTQHGDCAAAAADPPSRRNNFSSECDLFDRNSEPPDQPRNLVQMAGIGILDRSREPSEAFIVAHRGNVAGNNRWHCFQIGLDV
jgi:hypothetical protein